MKFSYLSLGGGLQSSVIAEMIAEGELLPVDVVLFADTGDEPDYVYQQVRYLKDRLGNIPLETVDNGNMIDDIIQSKGRFASIPVYTMSDGSVGRLRRQCTREYKITPIEKRVRGILLERGLAKQNSAGAIYINDDVEVDVLLGITLDEAQRMKHNRNKKFTNTYPLIDRMMTRHDCMLWLQKRGLLIPRKSSCLICPYHNDEYWRWLKDERPSDWDHVVKIDAHLRRGDFAARADGEMYLHRQCKPLPDIDLSTQQDHGQKEMFDECETGYCYT
jgi:hypothetical protein